MKVVVASKNPVKLQAAEAGFRLMFPEEPIDIASVSVASGVSDQPQSDTETLAGAAQRAANAMTALPENDYWVGLEGGVEANDEDLFAFAWCVVQSNDRVGKGKTGTIVLPGKIKALIEQGKELGEADDIVFGRSNSKQANGAVGLLTHDVVTRKDFYEQAVIFALIPFVNQELYQ